MVTDAEFAAAMRETEGRARAETADVPPATVQPTRYFVSCLPEGHDERSAWSLTVEYRGGGRWVVFRHALSCLGADGTWSWGYQWRDGTQEPATDDEWTEYHAGRDAWLAEHRFDLDTALRLAREHAPLITVNGYTVSDVLRMAEQRAGSDGA